MIDKLFITALWIPWMKLVPELMIRTEYNMHEQHEGNTIERLRHKTSVLAMIAGMEQEHPMLRIELLLYELSQY